MNTRLKNWIGDTIAQIMEEESIDITILRVELETKVQEFLNEKSSEERR